MRHTYSEIEDIQRFMSQLGHYLAEQINRMNIMERVIIRCYDTIWLGLDNETYYFKTKTPLGVTYTKAPLGITPETWVKGGKSRKLVTFIKADQVPDHMLNKKEKGE